MADSDLDKLLALSPNELREWLANQSRVRSPKELNWRGLASGASFRARRNAEQGDTEAALAWANAALDAYERMHDESSESSAMVLRAYFIRLLGPEAGDRLRDPEAIFSWCLEAIGDLTIDEALARSNALKDAIPRVGSDPVAQEQLAKEIRPLRLIKNRLSVPAILADNPSVPLPPTIRDWLAIRPKLP
jgi:hypothetical protein